MPRRLQALIRVSWILWVAGAGALAQQPQTSVQQAGSGLAPSVATFPNLSIASGNVLCSNATVTYAGGQVTTLQNGVNYVYFDCGTSVPKSSTSPFTGGQIPLAVVVAQSSSYGTSGLLDVRPWALTRTEPTPTGPVSALNVAGTTGLTWTNGGNNLGLVTLGTPTTGGSLYVNTPSLSSSYQSGLGIDGTYGTPSLQSVINIRALGVHSGTGYGSQLAFWTTKDANQNQAMTIDRNGYVGIAKAMGAGVNSVSFSATPTFDASKGNTQTITLTANVTSWSISNPTSGEWLIIQWCQDGTGGWTVSGTPPVKGFTTPGTTANKCSQQLFFYNGTNWYATATGTSNL